jgi:hypothetical protein
MRLHIRTLLQSTKQLDAEHRARRPSHTHDDPSHPRITPTTRFSVTVRSQIVVPTTRLYAGCVAVDVGSRPIDSIVSRTGALSMFSPTTRRPV